MRFFTPEVLDSSFEEFQSVKNDYWWHVETIRQRLPRRLYQLHRDYSLHDGRIVQVTQLRGGEDLGVTVEGVVNGHVANTDHCIYFLHFLGVRSGSLESAVGREIAVVETDLSKEGEGLVRFLHRDSDSNYLEDTLEFADFDYYLRDSRRP